MRRFAAGLLPLLGAYALLLLVAIIILPLRLGELLETCASLNFSFSQFMSWIAATPGGGPLHFFIQLPLALIGHHSRFFLRLPSLVAALAAVYTFFLLSKRVPLQTPLLATLLFAIIPVHFELASQGRPFELAMFLLLLATGFFFQLVETPDIKTAVLYGGALTLCLYTEPGSYFPAIGYVLALLRFAPGADQRRALWYALPATLAAALLYLPYFGWASPHRTGNWLNEVIPGLAAQSVLLQTLESLAPGTWSAWIGVVLSVFLGIGLIAGTWSSFPPFLWPLKTRIMLFCLAGGAFASLAVSLSADLWTGAAFLPNQALWAVPGLVLLTFSGLDWLTKSTVLRTLPVVVTAATALLAVLCLPSLYEYLNSSKADMEDLAMLVRPELTKGSCLVFVSEHLSPPLFELFDRQLAGLECQDFFHKRIVLASHAWVRPDQQRDAELFFRGLNFVEVKRQRVAGGQVLTMEAEK